MQYTIASKWHARRCKSCRSIQELLALLCNEQIATENPHILVMSVMGLIHSRPFYMRNTGGLVVWVKLNLLAFSSHPRSTPARPKRDLSVMVGSRVVKPLLAIARDVLRLPPLSFSPSDPSMHLDNIGATRVVTVQSSSGKSCFCTSPATRRLANSMHAVHVSGPSTSQNCFSTHSPFRQNWPRRILGRILK